MSPSGTELTESNAVFKAGSLKDFTIKRPSGEYELEVRKELGTPIASASILFSVANTESSTSSGTATFGGEPDNEGNKTAEVTLADGTKFTVKRSATNATNVSTTQFKTVYFDSSSTFNVAAQPETSGGTLQHGKYAMRNPNNQYDLQTAQTSLGYVAGNVYVVKNPAYATNRFLIESLSNQTVQVNVPGTVPFKLTFVAASGKTTIINFGTF